MKKYVIQVMGIRSQKYGGLERYMVKLASNIQLQGDSCILIYEEYPESTDFIMDIEYHGGQILKWPIKGTFILFISFIFRFVKLLLTKRIDIVHCHFGLASYVIPILSKFFFIKKRYSTIHSHITHNNK